MLGVVNRAVMTTTRHRDRDGAGESRAAAGQETFALVTFYLHHFREGSGPSTVWADINNVSGHKDFPATSHDIPNTELRDTEADRFVKNLKSLHLMRSVLVSRFTYDF